MNAPIWKMAPVKSLKLAAHNPPRRTEQKFLAALAASLEKDGMIYPILVGGDGVVIDGHRRLSAAKLLGWKEVPVIITAGNPSHIYAAVNSTSKKMTGNDALGVWLKNTEAVPEKAAARFTEMQTALGRSTVLALFNAGYSISFYNLARRIAAFCETDELVKPAVEWMLKCPVAGRVRKAMESGSITPRTIRDAIRLKKTLKSNTTLAA